VEHVRSSPLDSSTLLHAIAGIVIGVAVMFLLIGSVVDLFGRSAAGGLAAILALYIVGLCAWLTAREFARPA
jgi:hypothetical protein